MAIVSKVKLAAKFYAESLTFDTGSAAAFIAARAALEAAAQAIGGHNIVEAADILTECRARLDACVAAQIEAAMVEAHKAGVAGEKRRSG